MSPDRDGPEDHLVFHLAGGDSRAADHAGSSGSRSGPYFIWRGKERPGSEAGSDGQAKIVIGGTGHPPCSAEESTTVSEPSAGGVQILQVLPAALDRRIHQGGRHGIPPISNAVVIDQR